MALQETLRVGGNRHFGTQLRLSEVACVQRPLRVYINVLVVHVIQPPTDLFTASAKPNQGTNTQLLFDPLHLRSSSALKG